MQKTHKFLYLSGAVLLNAVVAGELEEVIVSAQHDARTIDVTSVISISPDPAHLLRNAPGANVASNGPISGIPQYRGLFGPRISVSLDGGQLAPAGPNWMDPPLSYAVSAQLEALEIYRGIAPVSVAQESIGGAIDARSRRVDYADRGQFDVDGRLVASAQSANSGYQMDADVQMASNIQRVKVGAMVQNGNDARFPGGRIRPSSYARERYDLGYGVRLGAHSLQLDYGRNRTSSAGTPALAMDIDYFDGDLYKLTYRYDSPDRLSVLASVFASDLEHGMTNFHLRTAPTSAARWRQSITDTRNRGFKLQVSLEDEPGLWRTGLDGFREEHTADIDNPNSPSFFVASFNSSKRSIIGAFIEREQALGHDVQIELGARVNRVRSDSGQVDGTPARMMAPAAILRDGFNAADRQRTDTNLDLVAKITYCLRDEVSLYAGLAQKQRAPSYQERYLWLPLEATAGLADGQLYVGEISLDPERARNLELGADITGRRFSLHPRIFHYRIDDYIQGTPLTGSHPASQVVRMMNLANETSRPDPLQFSNVAATLYGFDMDWAWALSDRVEVSGLVNYVRGKRRDVNDRLYRIAPPNMTLRLGYRYDTWQATLEAVAYAAQDEISVTNREEPSSGYGLVNFRGSWQVSPALQVALGVDNVLDKRYAPHLGGYNRVANPDVAIGERLPAMGVNLFGRVLYTF